MPAKKSARRKKAATTKTLSTPTEIRSLNPSTLEPGVFAIEPQHPGKGMATGSRVQSGDLQGLSSKEIVDSESVEELIAEGQSLEAEVVSGVEEAGEPDEGEVRTHEVPADDIPKEYLDGD